VCLGGGVIAAAVGTGMPTSRAHATA